MAAALDSRSAVERETNNLDNEAARDGGRDVGPCLPTDNKSVRAIPPTAGLVVVGRPPAVRHHVVARSPRSRAAADVVG